MSARILIYALNYAPEFVGAGKYTTELAEWLAGHGCQVRVICAPPYYPDWKVKKPYRTYWYRYELINGVEVWRCPIWVPINPNGFFRVLHLLTFAFSSLLPLLRNLFWKPDCLLLILPSLTCAPAAIVFSRISRCKSWTHIQDFELTAAVGLNITRRNIMFRFLEWLDGRFYRAFDRVSTISNRMAQRLIEENVPLDRISIIPNWVDTKTIHPAVSVINLRHELGLVTDDFVLLYAGTLNYKQNIDLVIDAARDLQGRLELKFVICGAGPELDSLKARAEGLRNLIWLEPQHDERFPQLLCLADVHLLPQRAGVADLVLPSKLGGILSSGKPVIATAEAGTEIADIVTGLGIVVPPSDHTALAAAILDLVSDPVARKQLGDEARRYAVANLDKSKVLSIFQDELIHSLGSSAVTDSI